MSPPVTGAAGATTPASSTAIDPGFLTVDGVTVRFGGLTALSEVSFKVARNTVHAVIGPNGAGKSTLFNVLTGFYGADEGSVTLDGRTITGRKPYELSRLGLGRTFQQPGLFTQMTVADNMLLGRHNALRSGYIAAGLRLRRSRREENEATERMLEMAKLLALEHVVRSRAGEIAYGEQKRVEIARTLLMEPTIVLFDEPVAGMNAYETEEMSELIGRLPRDFGVTVVLVEHDMYMVMTIADRVTVLDFGKRIADGLPAEVQVDPEVLRAYLGSSYHPHETRR